MNLERDALEYVSEQALKAAGATPLDTNSGIPVVVLDGSLKDVEKFHPAPVRHRQAFTTRTLAAFIAYAIAAAESQGRTAKAFVDPDNMTATAFFDLGDAQAPAWSTDSATLGMKKTAEFKALEVINERPLTQKQAADFAIDWAPNILFIGPDGEELSHAKALAAIRSITVKVKAETHNEERDAGRTRSAFEEAEASSKETLPAGFIFTASPFVGLDPREINVRVTVNTEGEKPSLSFRISGLEKLVEEIGEELVEKLEEGLGESAIVTIGSITSHN